MTLRDRVLELQSQQNEFVSPFNKSIYLLDTRGRLNRLKVLFAASLLLAFRTLVFINFLDW